MDEKARLQALEKQIEDLSAQIKEQYRALQQLHAELQSLKPASTVNPDTVNKKKLPIYSHPSSSLENLIGLRLIHLIGIVVLVIGLSLGVKYAIDKNLISEGLRIVLAYAAGLLLYFLSASLRKQYAAFSAILFSGAMASLYFTSFGACVYYHFLSYTASFVIMIALTVFTTVEALRYNRQEIALLGLVGAYGIPFLISPDRGHPEMLFLYISIINVGVVFLCAKKPWILVGRAAQAISWLLFIGWVVWQNDERLKTYGLVFMFAFFVQFAVNALSAKLFRKEPFSLFATYQILANNLLFYVAALFVFGYSFVDSTIAIISLLFAAFAAAQAVAFLFWKENIAGKLLAFYALALFVLFIGFQWKGITVTLLWLLTAVVIFVAGVKFKSIPARMAAIALMGFTLLKLVALDSLTFSTLQKVIAYLVLGVLLLVVSFFYQKFKEQLFGE
ncbi:DUF2339 domain-containing protein [Flavisolibacter ginsenosidimutans]|nr:DUF2339 domain-containing protein [Flavisolibacter ginsenosidimutans]